MAMKPGIRIEFGSVVEPCGGTVVSIRGKTVVVAWDSGGSSVMSGALLKTLSCEQVAGYPAATPLV